MMNKRKKKKIYIITYSFITKQNMAVIAKDELQALKKFHRKVGTLYGNPPNVFAIEEMKIQKED